MGFMSPWMIPKIKRLERVPFRDPPPLVHPAVNSLAERFVVLLGFQRSDKRQSHA